jgi:hypothetical protein
MTADCALPIACNLRCHEKSYQNPVLGRTISRFPSWVGAAEKSTHNPTGSDEVEKRLEVWRLWQPR